MPDNVIPLLAVGVAVVLVIVLFALLGNNNSLNGIKSKTVGDGQHGTARWATAQEVRKTYARVPFDVAAWRKGENRPTVQGLILGSAQRGKQIDALVDSDDVHCLMIGASGVGKTAFFLYPNLEFACASGMSFLALDTKGDLARNYGMIAQKYYDYRVSVVDLRNPTRSDGSNLLTLINRYMDLAKEQPDNLAHALRKHALTSNCRRFPLRQFWNVDNFRSGRFPMPAKVKAFAGIFIFKRASISQNSKEFCEIGACAVFLHRRRRSQAHAPPFLTFGFPKIKSEMEMQL